MKAIKLTGEIDEKHQLRAVVPAEVPTGPVRLVVLFADQDETGLAWERGVAREWADDLSDPRQDIYALDDGQPVNAPLSPQ